MSPYVLRASFLCRVPSRILPTTHRLSRPAISHLLGYHHRRYTHATSTKPTLPIFSLEGKVCIVTGASQGLGAEILTAFALSGAHGAVMDLSLEDAQKSVDKMKKIAAEAGLPDGDIQAYECNTGDETMVKETFAKIDKHFGRIDVVVLNAGITGGTPIEETDLKEWNKMFDVNVDGTFLCLKEAGKHMLAKNIKGSIMLVSSMSGVVVNRPQKQAAYNAGKAAVAHLAKSAASEWAEHGIRVNILSPGYIQTAANEGDEMKELSKEWVKMIPMGRIAKPEEFRGTAVWLASDASSYVTGSDIVVDGGYTVW